MLAYYDRFNFSKSELNNFYRSFSIRKKKFHVNYFKKVSDEFITAIKEVICFYEKFYLLFLLKSPDAIVIKESEVNNDNNEDSIDLALDAMLDAEEIEGNALFEDHFDSLDIFATKRQGTKNPRVHSSRKRRIENRKSMDRLRLKRRKRFHKK